jgi:hypothetical protein
MLAQSRSTDKTTTTTKEMDVDLLQGQIKSTDFDEIEAWLKAEKSSSNANDGEETITSKEFDKFLEERAAVADTLPNVNVSDTRSKKKQEEPLLG